jgi:ABC-type polysaccharide/polyol phosphate export permease
VLHLWFFATPVIYSYAAIAEGTPLRRALRLNPMTHEIVTYQQMLFHGNVDHWRGLFLALLVGLVAFAAGAFLFDRLRDTLPEEGCRSPQSPPRASPSATGASRTRASCAR